MCLKIHQIESLNSDNFKEPFQKAKPESQSVYLKY